ncbi:hypothetical protein PRIPAC_90212, partial [Pristionchus pacificus]
SVSKMRLIFTILLLACWASALPTIDEVKTILDEEIPGLKPLLDFEDRTESDASHILISYVMGNKPFARVVDTLRSSSPRFYDVFIPVYETYKIKYESLKEAEARLFVFKALKKAKELLKFRALNNFKNQTKHRVVIGEIKGAGQFLTAFDDLPSAAQNELLSTFSEIVRVLQRIFV